MTDVHRPAKPLLRLSGIQTADLPSPSASADELRPFVTALLEEAIPLIDSAAPRMGWAAKLWKSKGTKKFPESDGRVDLSERVVTHSSSSSSSGGGAGDAPTHTKAAGETAVSGVTSSTATSTTATPTAETWACRRSVHVDAATKGTASWAEFVDALRDHHVETEDAFTPTVLAHHVAVTWDGASSLTTVEAGGADAGADADGPALRWGRVGVSLVEMKHKMPAPLKPRVFPVLQVTVTSAGEGEGDEFVVVSVPVGDVGTGKMKDLARLSVEKGVVLGAYASVERVRRLPAAREGAGGAGGDGGRQIEWVMATASDAKGSLPMWIQTKAVPGAIAKDVSLFLSWVEGERRKQERGAGVSAGSGQNGTVKGKEAAIGTGGAHQAESGQEAAVAS